MTTTCSAPGKIYLFGEYVVLFGEPAIACAIDLRTNVTVKKSDNITISSCFGKKTGLDLETYPYISSAVEKLDIANISVDISSELPIGSGLGSSAAVTIATLEAINIEKELGYNKEELAVLGHEIEQKVQGIASPTDTFMSTFGGVVKMPEKKNLDILDCDIVVGNTKMPKKTAKLVKQVSNLREEHLEVINPIIKTIGSLSEKGEIFVNKKDYVSIGKLMNINNGLLDALGVGTCELDNLIYAARKAGAFGAKITGAGGGGCMVALTDSPENVASAIELAGGEAIITRATAQGVMEK